MCRLSDVLSSREEKKGTYRRPLTPRRKGPFVPHFLGKHKSSSSIEDPVSKSHFSLVTTSDLRTTSETIHIV